MSISGPDREAVRRGYDRSAATYDDRFHLLQRPKYAALLGAGAERLAGWLDRGPVLDLGCGTGLLGVFAQEHGLDHLRVVGLDYSAPMLAVARGRLGAAVHGESERLPFGDGAFEAVVAFTSLALGPDAEADTHALREIRRVLAPGGTAVVSVLVASASRIETCLQLAGFDFSGPLRCGQDVGYSALP